MLRITVPVHIRWFVLLGFYPSKEMRRLVCCLLKMHDLSELAFTSFVTLISSRVAGSAWSTDLSVLSLGGVCWCQCLLQPFALRSNRDFSQSVWMKTPWLSDSKFVLGHAVTPGRSFYFVLLRCYYSVLLPAITWARESTAGLCWWARGIISLSYLFGCMGCFVGMGENYLVIRS